MTDLKSYFPSPERQAAATVEEQHHQQTPTSAALTRTPTSRHSNDSAVQQDASIITPAKTAEEPIAATVVTTARPNSKLILQNMEEVLSSVKKQHRKKHRRKREQRKLAQQQQQLQLQQQQQQQQLDSDELVYVNGVEADPAVSKSRRKLKKPLQENGLNHTVKRREHRKSPQKHVQPHTTSPSSAASQTSNTSILNHFAQTPKKRTDDPATAKSMNAFEVMMNARNKTIGSNTPGKEAAGSPTTVADEDAAAAITNAKRKVMLQEWAERSGGAKRKLEDEMRGDYVDQQLENRAKRLKKLLENGQKVRPSTPRDRDLAPSLPSSAAADKLKENSGNGSAKSRRKLASAKGLTGRGRGRPRALRLSSTESNGLAGENESPALSEDEFLSKLSSPTKKRDSLLGYFPKKQLHEKADTAPVAIVPHDQERLQGAPLPADDCLHGAEAHIAETAMSRRRTPRRVARQRPTGPDSCDTARPESPAVTPKMPTTALSATRPKRSCAGKVRYDYADEAMASALPHAADQKRRGRPAAPLKETTKVDEPVVGEPAADCSVELITLLDDSNPEVAGGYTADTPKSEQPAGASKKLAPLFVRSMPKPSPDPEMLRARHKFLMSGVPEKMRVEKAKQRQYEQQLEDAFEWFPRVAHVRQYDARCHALLQRPHHVSHTLRPIPMDDDDAVGASGPHDRRFRLGSITTCTAAEWRAYHLRARTPRAPAPPSALPFIEHKRDIIKAWKAEFNGFPTYKCYNQLRGKYHYFSALDSAQNIEQVAESFVVTRRNARRPASDGAGSQLQHGDADAQAKPPATAPNGELLFTEKYKPLLFEQVLVNLTPVTQLRDFLLNWSNGAARNTQALLDDSLDLANDSNSSHSSALPCNTVVLLGPVSSGKSNAVCALANELNFNVLEINAGMKRTGKKLIQELQEATQSHQIRKESTPCTAKSQKNLLKMSLGAKMTKSRTLLGAAATQSVACDANSASCGNDSASAHTSRKCLILIEDADIVFDQTDAGFTDAIYTLAASSKRPVIVVANDPNAAHLQRLMNQNTITFNAPHVLKISQYLAVLSLLEDCPVNLDDLVSLYLYNRKDLRKTLIELQFFIQSGGDRRPMGHYHTAERQRQQYFASPTKRSAADASSANRDEHSEGPPNVYLHNTLFELFTLDQNAMYRIPFPVDFRILRPNLTDIFRESSRLRQPQSHPSAGAATDKGKARKSRSPKKLAAAWQPSPLEALCQFYENVSVASMLSDHIVTKGRGETPLHYTDRLVPHIEECIAHDLIEKGITVNLAVKACPHNLFETPKNSTNLCDYLGQTTSTITRTSRVCSLDYEPNLRAICRSEKLRSTLERRSTRFYHYLRNIMVNPSSFSTDYLDAACQTFQTDHAADDDQPPNGSGETS